jgi:hypothetical protein
MYVLGGSLEQKENIAKRDEQEWATKKSAPAPKPCGPSHCFSGPAA